MRNFTETKVPTAQKTVSSLKDRKSVMFAETITAYCGNTRKQTAKPFGKTERYLSRWYMDLPL